MRLAAAFVVTSATGGCPIDIPRGGADGQATNAPDDDALALGDGLDGADDTSIDYVPCESDDDCAPYAGCCLDPRCRDGQCLPYYVPACCTTPDQGPCATTTAFHTGTCEATCVAHGCVESLSLPPGSCSTDVWSLTRDATGILELSFSDYDTSDRVTWTLDAGRPFGGAPSLHAGDVVCPTYYDGPLGADCRPLATLPDGSADDAGAITLGLDTPPIALASDHPSIAQLWLWIDVGEGHVDGLTVNVAALNGPLVPVWDSRTAPAASLPRATWTPIVVDLSEHAGETIRIGLRFETFDGRDNDHPGVYLGELRVRGLCADDTTCPAPAPCAAVRQVAVTPFADVSACVVAPADPGPACVACTSPATCPTSDPCDVATCDLGVCGVHREVTAACCTSDATWPGDASFEGPLEGGWETEPGWAISAVDSDIGTGSLHFGLSDGSGIAEPGEAAAGTVWSPPVTLPRDAPVWSFALKLSTEWDAMPSADNIGGLDLLEALITPVATAPVAPAVVWDSKAIGGTTSGAWDRIRIALDAFAGQTVRLGWRFQTGDAHANDGGGVYIDDARIFRACPGCGSEALSEACDPGTVEP